MSIKPVVGDYVSLISQQNELLVPGQRGLGTLKQSILFGHGRSLFSLFSAHLFSSHLVSSTRPSKIICSLVQSLSSINSLKLFIVFGGGEISGAPLQTLKLAVN